MKSRNYYAAQPIIFLKLDFLPDLVKVKCYLSATSKMYYEYKESFKQKILLVILLVVLLRKHQVNLYFYVDLLFLAYLHEKGSVCPHKHPRKGNENHKKCTYQNQTIRMFGFNFTSACFITSH